MDMAPGVDYPGPSQFRLNPGDWMLVIKASSWFVFMTRFGDLSLTGASSWAEVKPRGPAPGSFTVFVMLDNRAYVYQWGKRDRLNADSAALRCC
jgi:hypothetical protein